MRLLRSGDCFRDHQNSKATTGEQRGPRGSSERGLARADLRYLLRPGARTGEMLLPICQISAQGIEIEAGKRAVRALEIAQGTFQNRARTDKVALGLMMKSDRQLNHTLDMQTEMRTETPTRGAVVKIIARYRAPNVFENLMRVEEVGVVEQIDTPVDLCVVERHGYSGLALHRLYDAVRQSTCFHRVSGARLPKLVEHCYGKCMSLKHMSVIRFCFGIQIAFKYKLSCRTFPGVAR